MVKYSPHARAIRDVEDDELRSFFYGMSPWQVYIAILYSYHIFFSSSFFFHTICPSHHYF